MSNRPVESWETDFDISDDRYQSEPASIWRQLRTDCPVAHTDRRGGAVLPIRWDDLAAVAYDTDRFSSRDIGVMPPPNESSTLLVAPPITSDPPFHGQARRILLPRFSPRAVASLEARTRANCVALLDALDGASHADAAGDYAQHIPVQVIAHMLGIPSSDEAMFTDWAIDIFQRSATEPEIGSRATRAILDYFIEEVERKRTEPGDDLISELLAADLDGAPLTERHVLGTCFLLLMAGIDTTWSAIGASLWHLATHSEDRDRLVNDPGLLPTAIEELLRVYAPVTMARIATADTEISGCPVTSGERVLLPFAAGNRDPNKFERPDEALLDRSPNRHMAFGIGIHRCLGSNLARMELRVAIETWLTRFPRFELAPGADVRWTGTQVRGPRTVPVSLG